VLMMCVRAEWELRTIEFRNGGICIWAPFRYIFRKDSSLNLAVLCSIY
jgi:hypothetical protein